MATKYTEFEFIKRYDEKNNLIYIKDIAHNREIWISYDEKNRMIQKRNSNGYAEFYDYDDATNTLFYRNTRGEYRHTKKDINGKVLWDKTANSDTFFSYDENGNCIEEKHRNGTSIKYEYDNRHNLLRSINSVGYEEKFEYNSKNQLIGKTNSFGLVIDYKYDQFDNLIFEKNNSSKVEKFMEYILINGKWLISDIKDTNGNEEHYLYDEKGNRIKYFESVFEKTYQYDENNNLISYSRKYIKEK